MVTAMVTEEPIINLAKVGGVLRSLVVFEVFLQAAGAPGAVVVAGFVKGIALAGSRCRQAAGAPGEASRSGAGMP